MGVMIPGTSVASCNLGLLFAALLFATGCGGTSSFTRNSTVASASLVVIGILPASQFI